MVQGIIENTGERFIPTQSDPAEIFVNIDRYRYAMSFCMDKNVLELGCGSGLGTYLYSLIANHVTAVDYSDEAITYAKQFPFGPPKYSIPEPEKVEFLRMDLEKETPQGRFDVVVAIEVLEHLANPKKVLAELDTKHLIFSLPLNSMEVSSWHKYQTRGGEQGVKDIRDLIEDKYIIEDLQIQEKIWVHGKARKRKSWI